MKKKTCSRCKDPKPVSEFCKCARMKDGLQSACKTCMNESYNRSRKKKQYHYQEIAKQRQHKNVARFNNWKEAQHCITCGDSDTDMLDLHHLDSTQKDANISEISGMWSWERLQTELAKCVVICCKCHRKVHLGRLTIL